MLSSEERKTIEEALLTSTPEHTFKLEASGIARLYYGQGGSWKYSKIIGAATLINDYPADNDSAPVASYIIIANPKDGSVLFTQELYEGFEYATPKPFFHCFDSDNGIAGLSFAENSNPEKFADAVNSAISHIGGSSAAPVKKPPRPSRKAAPPAPAASAPAPAPQPVASSPSPAPVVEEPPAPTSPSVGKKEEKKKEGKKKKGFLGLFGRSKGDDDEVPEDFVISGPTGFRHQSHIGWDPENGFDVKNLPPEWKKVFQEAGVKKSELSNPETSAVILQVIQEHTGGGLENPPPQSDSNPEPSAGAPAPPPPPPLPQAGAGGAPPPPPPPPPMPGAATPYRDSSAAPAKPAGAPAPPGGDGRGDLLSQIRGGAQLRKVEIADKPPTLESTQGQGLVGALRNAMNNRRGFIKEDEDEDEDEDDVWSD